MIIDTMLKDKNVIGELVFKIDVDTKMFEEALNKVKAQYKAELDKCTNCQFIELCTQRYR